MICFSLKKSPIYIVFIAASITFECFIVHMILLLLILCILIMAARVPGDRFSREACTLQSQDHAVQASCIV